MSFKKFYFASGRPYKQNTFIGGVASTIGTKELLASKLKTIAGADFNPIYIKNFEIIGNSVRCYISEKYLIVQDSFGQNTGCTYFIGKNCAKIGVHPFRNFPDIATNALVKFVDFNSAISIERDFTNATRNNLRSIRLNSLTSIEPLRTFTNMNNCKLYIPSLQVIGSPSVNEGVFDGCSDSKIYTHPFLQTCNAGAPDADLVAAIAAGNTVIYVLNTSAPARITNLTSGSVTTTTIQLNFTPPSSTNTIEAYEVEIDGVWYQDITASGQSITGLTAGTKYKNIAIKARDIYYNRAEEESNAIPEVETAAIVIDIVTDFKTRVLADGGTFENEAALRVFSETLVIGNTTLALAPSSFKAGKLYNLLPTIPNDFNVSRSGTKTRINSLGVLETMAANVLAPDYSTGVARLMIEPYKTNIYPISENFVTGFSKSNLTILSNTLNSPYGASFSNKASTVVENTGVFTSPRLFRGISIVAGNDYTFSIFAKAKDRNFIRMQPAHGFNTVFANFDLANGTIGLTDGGNPRIYNLADGWKRVGITVKATGTGTFYPSACVTIDADNNTGYAGTGAECFYIFGAMCVEGTEMGSYTPSLGTMGVTNADIATATTSATTIQIKENLENGTANTITTIPPTYQVPFGRYKSIIMTK